MPRCAKVPSRQSVCWPRGQSGPQYHQANTRPLSWQWLAERPRAEARSTAPTCARKPRSHATLRRRKVAAVATAPGVSAQQVLTPAGPATAAPAAPEMAAQAASPPAPAAAPRTTSPVPSSCQRAPASAVSVQLLADETTGHVHLALALPDESQACCEAVCAPVTVRQLSIEPLTLLEPAEPVDQGMLAALAPAPFSTGASLPARRDADNMPSLAPAEPGLGVRMRGALSAAFAKARTLAPGSRTSLAAPASAAAAPKAAVPAPTAAEAEPATLPEAKTSAQPKQPLGFGSVSFVSSHSSCGQRVGKVARARRSLRKLVLGCFRPSQRAVVGDEDEQVVALEVEAVSQDAAMVSVVVAAKRAPGLTSWAGRRLSKVLGSSGKDTAVAAD